MTALPSASVIVPVRNGAATLEPCIHSLLDLDYPRDRLELIFVDNASHDATASILDRHRDAIRVLREARRGAGAARNAGLRAAGGDVIAFTDADCVVDPEWLRSLVVALDDRRDRVVGGTILALRPAGRCELFGERIHDHRRAIESDTPPYVITMSFAAPLSGPLRHVRFDESLIRCQDVDLSYRLFEAGCTFTFVPGAIVYHRNESSLGGLFREGFKHGYWAVRARKKHRALRRSHGHGLVAWRAHAGLVPASAAALRGREGSGPELAFLGGKATGGLVGSFRFRHPSL